MMKQYRRDIAEIIADMETELHRLSLWRETPPAPEALSSPSPFCCDTLPFDQWLQWMFIPRMRHVLEEELPLPRESGILPMAEEALKDLQRDALPLLRLIGDFDRLIGKAGRFH